MKLCQKIIFFVIVLLCLVFVVIVLVVCYQVVELVCQQCFIIEVVYLVSKNIELCYYVDLVQYVLVYFYDIGCIDDVIKEEVWCILFDLVFGDDGYFFVYDDQGCSIMYLCQLELVGCEMWDWCDDFGSLIIQYLIECVYQGGGFECYLWCKFFSKMVVFKLGYVIVLLCWGWVIGIGIYLDDVEVVLVQVDYQNFGYLYQIMLLIVIIVLFSVLVVGLVGLLLNLSEYCVVDVKLCQLVQCVVCLQEEECVCFLCDLYDGISQWLVFIKLQIEVVLECLCGMFEQVVVVCIGFEKIVIQINGVLVEVCCILYDLWLVIFDDFGLVVVLEYLCGEWCESSLQIQIVFEYECQCEDGVVFLDVVNIVLFCVV